MRKKIVVEIIMARVGATDNTTRKKSTGFRTSSLKEESEELPEGGYPCGKVRGATRTYVIPRNPARARNSARIKFCSRVTANCTITRKRAFVFHA